MSMGNLQIKTLQWKVIEYILSGVCSVACVSQNFLEVCSLACVSLVGSVRVFLYIYIYIHTHNTVTPVN